ncbi:hypothetical protein [Rhodococcus jostii]|uniref:Excreted virulence factor EspC, type VII ESX diderm n=1 Tax=Rhodococcus jostii TaxID=132919 RepID=A0A1H5JD29_RHOJO|nr:hypothetical protein [Rhodococcus jostii]SEE49548.1 hypothetical protein SAMN04490220_8067 [Rhodococcus jostii]
MGLGAAAAGPLLGPVLGVIGGDFATAHAAHLASIEKLLGVLGGISSTARANAATYEGTEAATTDALGADAVGLEA